MFPADRLRKAIKDFTFPQISQNLYPETVILILRLVSTSKHQQNRHQFLYVAGPRVLSQVNPPDRDKILKFSEFNILPKPSRSPILRQMIRSLEPPKTWIPKISFAPNNLSEVAGQKYWQRVVAATSSQGLLMNHNTKDRHEVPPSVHVSQFGSSDIMTATPSKNSYQQEYFQRV